MELNEYHEEIEGYVGEYHMKNEACMCFFNDTRHHVDENREEKWCYVDEYHMKNGCFCLS